MHTQSGRLLDYKETVGRIVVLDYNKSILSKAFNPSKFDFNPWDLEKKEQDQEKDEKDKGGPTISFRLYNAKSFKIKKGDRLGWAALISTVGVSNWLPEDFVEEKFVGEDTERQIWDYKLKAWPSWARPCQPRPCPSPP